MRTLRSIACLLWLLGMATAPAVAADERKSVSFPVSFETEDGFTLHGSLTSAGTTESPVAILLHMYRNDRTSWDPLVPELVGKGITVLALDQRAHGESIRRGDETVRVADIPREEFGAWVRDGVKDVAAARKYLAGRGFDVSRIGLVGASYGCTVSLLAAEEVAGVRALALLSPGTAYFGVEVRSIAKELDRPILAVAAEDDGQAAASARTLTDGRRARSDLEVFEKGGHGTNLFAPHPDLAVTIREFLREAFGMVPGR